MVRWAGSKQSYQYSLLVFNALAKIDFWFLPQLLQSLPPTWQTQFCLATRDYHCTVMPHSPHSPRIAADTSLSKPERAQALSPLLPPFERLCQTLKVRQMMNSTCSLHSGVKTLAFKVQGTESLGTDLERICDFCLELQHLLLLAGSPLRV